MGMSGRLALVVELVQEVDQKLGALHGKGRNDDLAPALAGASDRLFEGLRRLLQGRVGPAAIGALDEQDVGGRQTGGVAQQRHVRPAQVAGKDQAPGGLALPGLEIQGHDG